MTLYDLLSYIDSYKTTVIVKTKDDDGVVLGSNRPHEEFPEFIWNKEINLMYTENGELIVLLEATNDDVEGEVLNYLVKECGYTWEEATTKWNKAKLESEEN